MFKILADFFDRMSEVLESVEKSEFWLFQGYIWPININPEWFDPEDPES